MHPQVTDEEMIIDVIVEIETIIGETVVMTTIGTDVDSVNAIEMSPDDSASDRVAIAGHSGCAGIIVNTSGTPARIGDSGDSSGTAGDKLQ